MAQRQSRDRFDPYEQYGAGNDESWGGRGRRDEERESWGGGRMRGEGWRGAERGGDYEPSRSYEVNRYRGGYGGPNEQWSEDYQSDWRRRPMEENRYYRDDRYRGGPYGGGYQEYGRGGMGGDSGWQPGHGREREYPGGYGREPQWSRSDSGSGYGAWQDPYGHADWGGSRNPYAYGSGYGGGATDTSWGHGDESGMGGIHGSPGSAGRGEREGGRMGHSFRGVGPQGYERSDDKLKETICERLTEHPGIDPSNVQVQVNRGEVTLQGQVRDRDMKHRIEDLVDNCGGVKEIHNQLRVQSQPASQSGQYGGSQSQSGAQGQSGQQQYTLQHAAQSGQQSGQLGSSRGTERSSDHSKQQR